jgi:hypothetical protein
MRDSDALLTLVGAIFHGDPEYWGKLYTAHHGKGPVQSRLARRLTQVQCSHPNILELEASSISHSLCLSRSAGVRTAQGHYNANIYNSSRPKQCLLTQYSPPSHLVCRHFSTRCRKIGPKPQSLKVDRYQKTVDRT